MTDRGQVIRPLVAEHLDEIAQGGSLSVTCDGYPARLSLDSATGWSIRLHIAFDVPHPEFGELFETKHFGLEGPGRIAWGHEGRSFRILLSSPDR